MITKFSQIRSRTSELAVLERWKNSNRLIMGKTTPSIFSTVLIGYFSYLHVTRTCIKALMSLNFGQIPPLTTELAAFEHLKMDVTTFFSVAINPVPFKLAGYEAMHNILGVFQFRPDWTICYRVSCPLVSKNIQQTYNEIVMFPC